jgi:hypothetical protein
MEAENNLLINIIVRAENKDNAESLATSVPVGSPVGHVISGINSEVI